MTMTIDTTRLLYWIREREAIRLRRAAGQSRSWTDDPILATWSFTNVRREYDYVTTWIRENWREPHAADQDLFFAMAVARLVNWPDSLAAIGFPLPWNRERFTAALQARMAEGHTTWGPAYNISNAGKRLPKVDVVAGELDALWARRKQLRPRAEDSLHTFYGRLRQMRGFDSFMAGQVVADTKYVEPLKSARDWWTFAAPGPGSEPGLNRVLGRPKDTPWRDEDAWRAALARLHEMITPDLAHIGVGRLCAQDLQHCLCEFNKYEKTRLGEGKPKRKFVPRPHDDQVPRSHGDEAAE
jgi:alpha-glutamyl/putrescinyl thymine pyrophosphorylase clade 1